MQEREVKDVKWEKEEKVEKVEYVIVKFIQIHSQHQAHFLGGKGAFYYFFFRRKIILGVWKFRRLGFKELRCLENKAFRSLKFQIMECRGLRLSQMFKELHARFTTVPFTAWAPIILNMLNTLIQFHISSADSQWYPLYRYQHEHLS